MPHAVSDPQVAAVGLTEEQARERGLSPDGQESTATPPTGGVEDTEHRQVLADLGGKRLIGAISSALRRHRQPTADQAMSFGTPVRPWPA